MNLNDFIQLTWPPNSWISENHITIYVRKSNRLIEGKMTECLDLATVEVDEDERGKGIFTTFLHRFEQEAKKLNRVVFVENIMNPCLESYLVKKQGYTLIPNDSGFSPCAFKIIA